MSDRNIRERFGLDYLLNPAGVEDEAIRKKFGADYLLKPPSLDDARAFVRYYKVLGPLRTGPQRLRTLIEHGLESKKLVPLVLELDEKGHLAITDWERFGNWEVTITEQGQQFLKEMGLT